MVVSQGFEQRARKFVCKPGGHHLCTEYGTGPIKRLAHQGQNASRVMRQTFYGRKMLDVRYEKERSIAWTFGPQRQ